MKKIGILTFQNANNFGAVLQAYALQETIKKIASTPVEIINYDSPQMQLKKIQSPIFKDFIKHHLNLSMPYSDPSFFDDDYSAIIVGSDQVWNPELTGYDTTYFLSSLPKTVKKISYAASIGLNVNYLSSYSEFFQAALTDFSYLSLRERTHVGYLSALLNRPVIASLDPTLLLTAKEYTQDFQLQSISDKYIFLFSYAVDSKPLDMANLLSLQTGYPIICYSLYYKSVHLISGSELYSSLPPENWLTYIKNASLIITDSFHGVMLSIAFNKPFYAYTPNRYNMIRVLDALELLNLSDRRLSTIKNTNDIKFDLDYTSTNIILKSERQKTINYLTDALNQENI